MKYNSGPRYTFYSEQLRTAENPHATFVGMALSIGKCTEYSKTEKGRALETLTQAWTDFAAATISN